MRERRGMGMSKLEYREGKSVDLYKEGKESREREDWGWGKEKGK